MVAIGGSWEKNIEAYAKVTGHRPQGTKFYCTLRGEKDVKYFWHNGRNNIPPDGFLVMEASFDETTEEGIRLMGEAIKEFGRPVFADLEAMPVRSP